MGGYIGVQSTKLLQVTYFISGYTNILPGLFSTPDHLTGICRVPPTSGSPLRTAPGDKNPSRPFKLSPWPTTAWESWTASLTGYQEDWPYTARDCTLLAQPLLRVLRTL